MALVGQGWKNSEQRKQIKFGVEGGLNTYAYVSGNPLMLVDPYGLLEWSDVTNYGRGFGSYFRGIYRGGVQVARRTGALGSGERDAALNEDALLAQALQQLKDPAIRALALKEAAEIAANNKSFLAGRVTAGFLTGTGLSGVRRNASWNSTWSRFGNI